MRLPGVARVRAATAVLPVGAAARNRRRILNGCSSFRGRSRFLRTEPGIQFFSKASKSWIPGSIADEAGDPPGMTMERILGGLRSWYPDLRTARGLAKLRDAGRWPVAGGESSKVGIRQARFFRRTQASPRLAHGGGVCDRRLAAGEDWVAHYHRCRGDEVAATLPSYRRGRCRLPQASGNGGLSLRDAKANPLIALRARSLRSALPTEGGRQAAGLRFTQPRTPRGSG